jgi:hypothetical protein
MRLARALDELAPIERALLDLSHLHKVPDSGIAAFAAVTPERIRQHREEVVAGILSLTGAPRRALVAALEVPPPGRSETTARLIAERTHADPAGGQRAQRPAVPARLLRWVAFAVMPIASIAAALVVVLGEPEHVTTTVGAPAGEPDVVALRAPRRGETAVRSAEPLPVRIISRAPSSKQGLPGPPRDVRGGQRRRLRGARPGRAVGATPRGVGGHARHDSRRRLRSTAKLRRATQRRPGSRRVRSYRREPLGHPQHAAGRRVCTPRPSCRRQGGRARGTGTRGDYRGHLRQGGVRVRGGRGRGPI